MRVSARVDRTHLGSGHGTTRLLFSVTVARSHPGAGPAYFRVGTGLAHSSQQASGVRRLKEARAPMAEAGEGTRAKSGGGGAWPGHLLRGPSVPDLVATATSFTFTPSRRTTAPRLLLSGAVLLVVFSIGGRDHRIEGDIDIA
jgi:hypothetical protein